MTEPEIHVGMRIEDKTNRVFEITEIYDNDIELDGEHHVSRDTLTWDIKTGKTTVISE